MANHDRAFSKGFNPTKLSNDPIGKSQTLFEKLSEQQWDSGEGVVRCGSEMCARFVSNWNSPHSAYMYFAESKIGDCYKTSVSAYTRVK